MSAGGGAKIIVTPLNNASSNSSDGASTTSEDSGYDKLPRVNHAIRLDCAFNALTLLVGWQEGHPACKKTKWWGAGVVISLERGADLHTAQLMPLPLTASCFNKIQMVFYLSGTGSPG